MQMTVPISVSDSFIYRTVSFQQLTAAFPLNTLSYIFLSYVQVNMN